MLKRRSANSSVTWALAGDIELLM